MLDYPELLSLMEGFKQRSLEQVRSDQHELLVDFLRYGVEEKEKELESVKAQHSAITADLKTVLVCFMCAASLLLIRSLLIIGTRAAQGHASQ